MDTVISRSSARPILEHRGWRAARTDLLHVLRAGPGLTALLGPPGTGKSMMLQEVARTLLADGVDVTALRRGDAVDELELQGIVLIDEADRLAPGALAVLAARDDLSVVLATLPGFADRLPDLPGIKTVTLVPLGPAEAAELVEARLAQGSHAPDLLTPAAITELFRRSGGIPRVLHTLTDLAIFAASLEDAPRVTPAHVVEAVSFREGAQQTTDPAQQDAEHIVAPDAMPTAVSPIKTHHSRWGAWATAAAVLLCLAATLLPLGASAPLRPAALASDTIPTGPTPTSQPVAPAAAATLASDGALLPPGSLTRVVLSYPAGNADAARRGADLARRLRADGITTGEPVPASPTATESALLYYFAQDRDGAAAVGRKLDGQFGEPVLARLPPRSTLPRPGTIELMLAMVGP